MHGHRVKKHRPRRRNLRNYTAPTHLINPTTIDTTTPTDATTELLNDWRRHHETLNTLNHPNRDRGALLAAAGALLAIEETLRRLGCPPPAGSWTSDKVA